MKKTISITKLSIGLLASQAIILVCICLTVSAGFFDEIATDIYYEMNTSIAGAALGLIDDEELQELAGKTNAVVQQKSGYEEYEQNQGGWLESFSAVQETELYQKIWKELNVIREGTSSTALDYVLLYPETGMEVFIIDASGANVLPCGETHIIDTSALLHSENREFGGFETYSPVYGRLRTDGVFVWKDETTGYYAYLLSDIPTSEIRNRSRAFMIKLSLTMVLAMILVGEAVILCLRNMVVRPITEISEAAAKFADNYEQRAEGYETSDTFSKISSGNTKELNKLSFSLQSMEKEMGDYLHDLKKISMEQARVETELSLASRIQMGSLPTDFTLNSNRQDFRLFASMKPAKEVGGDFYDFFMMDATHLVIVIADVSGKGIPAALFMMMSKYLMENLIMAGRSPKEAMREANNQICMNNKEDMFVTIWLGVLDLESGRIRAVNAGHEYPAVKKPDGQFELLRDKHGLCVGAMSEIEYTEYELEIELGSKLFLYTDGLPEATDSREKMFGTASMIRTLNEIAEGTAEEILGRMHQAVDQFVGSAPQFDDLTMLCLEYNGNGEGTAGSGRK